VKHVRCNGLENEKETDSKSDLAETREAVEWHW
jgi:hypothetical protein